MEHYRCYQVWARDTRSERIADTLAWFPALVEMPKTSSADAALIAAQQLTVALRNPSPATPLAPILDEHRTALDQLAKFFAQQTKKPNAPPPRVSEAQPTKPREPPRVSDKSDGKPGSKSKYKAAPDSKLELESTRLYPDVSTFKKMFGDTQFTGTVLLLIIKSDITASSTTTEMRKNWDKIVLQCVLSLNLLRKSRINPLLSAYAQLEGAFDFNKTPLAPVGTKVIIHKKPTSRPPWSPHGVNGWYLGPAMEHYRCYQVWARNTRSKHVADTIAWFPALVEMPKTSSADATLIAAQQ